MLALAAAVVLSPVATFRNPIVDGADPFLVYSGGEYVLAVTLGDRVGIRRAKRIGELGKAPIETVWTGAGEFTRDVWAPEFHRLESGRGPRWYLYVTAGKGPEPSHRMFVAESERDDIRGPYTTKGQLRTDPKDEFYAIDGTVIRLPDRRLYFVWCGRPSPAGQGLYISRMRDPWTLEGERRYLDVSGLGSDVVREGPVALQRGGKVSLVYSVASADSPEYRLGMTVADSRAELMDPAVWRQRPKPVFVRDDKAEVFGPGHNSFFKSPDGREDWIVYHAKPSRRVGYGDRSTRAQRFGWGRDGDPVFGRPLPVDEAVRVPSGER